MATPKGKLPWKPKGKGPEAMTEEVPQGKSKKATKKKAPAKKGKMPMKGC